MKIKKIKVQNLKAVANAEIDLNGASILMTARNNAGKSTILKGLIDRFQGKKPSMIVREGEQNGTYEMELTDGSIIKWSFTEKTEKFTYITKEGLPVTNSVLSAIGERYFGKFFDVNKFLNSSPSEQVKILQQIAGIDFSEIDKKIKELYDERTLQNRKLKELRALKLEKPEPVEKPDIESVKQKLAEVKAENDELLKDWEKRNKEHVKSIEEENIKIIKENKVAEKVHYLHETLETLRDSVFDECIDFEKAGKIKEQYKILPLREITYLPKPELQDVSELEKALNDAYVQLNAYENYERELERYEKWVKEGSEVKEKVQQLTDAIEELRGKKIEMIQNANLPEEFSFSENNELLYNGFVLSDSQISTSAKYIAGLKLGAMLLGEIKALHFDASTLDNISLREILKWAEENDYQLLIERPDYDGGEIKYEIIQNL